MTLLVYVFLEWGGGGEVDDIVFQIGMFNNITMDSTYMEMVIQPSAAESLLDDDTIQNPAFRRELKDIVSRDEELRQEVPQKDIDDIIQDATGVEDFSLSELSDCESIYDYYDKKHQELISKYKNDELTDEEFENKLESVLEEKMNYE